jgi:sulfatase modifying factor 1
MTSAQPPRSRRSKRLVAVLVVLLASSCDDVETVAPAHTAGMGNVAGGGAGTTSGGGEPGEDAGAGQAGDGAGSGGDGGGQAGDGAAGWESGWGGQSGEGGASAPGPTPPSCHGAVKSCGPNGDDDCCASTLLPATSFGEFARGNDPLYPATLSDFRLDRYEVTVGRFRKFADAYAAGFRPAEGSGKNENNSDDTGWDPAWNEILPDDATAADGGVACEETFQTFTPEPGENESEDRPINCVSWYLAYAFCIWDAARLPTEAEWNFAAAGGGDALGWRQYPWSEPSSSVAIDEMHASYYSTDCLADGEAGCSLSDIIPVGTKPAGNGRWGHADLAGNLGEWSQDLYDTYVVPCNDCANLSTSMDRVFRGGAYDNEASSLLTSARRGRNPKRPAENIGVRCARSAH